MKPASQVKRISPRLTALHFLALQEKAQYDGHNLPARAARELIEDGLPHEFMETARAKLPGYLKKRKDITTTGKPRGRSGNIRRARSCAKS